MARVTKNKKLKKTRKQEKLESKLLNGTELISETIVKPKKIRNRELIEHIMFDLPFVSNPLIGTPKQVQKHLDLMVKQMQKKPNNDKLFNKIHLYIHGYLINVVLRKFPFIRGLQTADIYQETLIALRFKAIPNFKTNKGMSFLNFAKMCIRRHLITLLNTSKNRKKDQSINQAVSLESYPMNDNGDEKNTFSNIIPDNKANVDDEIEYNEAYRVTRDTLLNSLSRFERIVLSEYLANASYRDISRYLSQITKKRCNTKSIDNALLRIRKKAIYLRKHVRDDDLPLFINR